MQFIFPQHCSHPQFELECRRDLPTLAIADDRDDRLTFANPQTLTWRLEEAVGYKKAAFQSMKDAPYRGSREPGIFSPVFASLLGSGIRMKSTNSLNSEVRDSERKKTHADRLGLTSPLRPCLDSEPFLRFKRAPNRFEAGLDARN